MTKTEFLSTILTKKAEKWGESRTMLIMGLIVDPIPNSSNWHYKSCIADSNKILGVKWSKISKLWKFA